MHHRPISLATTAAALAAAMFGKSLSVFAAPDASTDHAAIKQLAHEEYRSGNLDRSLSLFTEVANTAADPIMRADAWRMIGQIHLYGQNKPAEAEIAYAHVLELAGGARTIKPLIADALEKKAAAEQLQHKYRSSIETRETQLNRGLFLHPDAKAIALLETARDYQRVGEAQKSTEYFDRVLTETTFPGSAGGRLGLELERIAAKHGDAFDAARMKDLLTVWHKSEYQNELGAINPARQAMLIAARLRDSETLDSVGRELETWITAKAATQKDDLLGLGIADQWGQAVLSWGGNLRLRKNITQTLQVYSRFLQLFPGSDFAPEIRGALEQILKAEFEFDLDARVSNIQESAGAPAPLPAPQSVVQSSNAQPIRASEAETSGVSFGRSSSIFAVGFVTVAGMATCLAFTRRKKS